jgi:hypothetical protein
MEVELAEDAGDVVLDRLIAEKYHVRDFLVRPAGSDMRQDLALLSDNASVHQPLARERMRSHLGCHRGVQR